MKKLVTAFVLLCAPLCLQAQTVVQGPTVFQSSGSGTVAGQTTNCLPKAASATALAASSAVCDNGTNVTSTEPVAVPTPVGSAPGNFVATKNTTRSWFKGAWFQWATYDTGDVVSTAAGTYVSTCPSNQALPPNAYPTCWYQIGFAVPNLSGTIPISNLNLNGQTFKLTDKYGNTYLYANQVTGSNNTPILFTGATLEYDPTYSSTAGTATATSTFEAAGYNGASSMHNLYWWNGTTACRDQYTEQWASNASATVTPTAILRSIFPTSTCTALPELWTYNFPAGSQFTFGPKIVFNQTANAGARFAGSAADPASPLAGDIWYNTTSQRLGFRTTSNQQIAFLSDLPSLTNYASTTNAVALASGTTAATQSTGDTSNKLATDAFVSAAVASIGGSSSLCKQAAPTANTGATTANVAYSCTVPANTLSASASVEIDALFYSPSANTGTCSVGVEFYTSSTESAGARIATLYPISTGGRQAILKGFVQNAGSTSSQTATAVVQVASGTLTVPGSPTSYSITTAAAASYVNFVIQNSVAGDNCYLERAVVRVQN